jgi:hypothetical protein
MFMYRKRSFSGLFFTAGIIGLTMVTAAAQSKRNQQPAAVDSKTYERVLDLLFPRDVLKDHKIRYAFVLRYEPTFLPESQIVIIGRQEGVEVITYKSLDGSIETRLDNMLRSGTKEDPDRMAKRLRIQKLQVKLPNDMLKEFHRNFFESLRLAEETRLQPAPDSINVVADGTTYRLWYVGETNIQCELQGSGVSTTTQPHEPALMEWLKDVSRRVAIASGGESNTSVQARKSTPER